MKKIFYIVLMLVTITSCSDRFLDETPKGSWHHGNYEDDGSSDKLLILSKLFEGYDSYRAFDFVFPVISMQSISTGDGVAPNGSDGGTDYVQCWNLSFTTENSQVKAYYTALYTIITKANTALQMIEETKAKSEDNYDEFIAEAYFLRGSAYFRLCQAFGSVPYVDKLLNKDDKIADQKPVSEIWHKCKEDLEWASTILPSRIERVSTGNQGRATANACLAIIAKIQMYEKDWGGCASTCQRIILSGDNDLSTPYADMFLEKNEYGPESVWEINAEYDPLNKITPAPDCQWLQAQGYRGFPNLGWGHNGPSEKLRNAYEKDDPRYDATVIEPGEELDGEISSPAEGMHNYFNRKCYLPLNERKKNNRDDWCYGYWTNIRVIRYADIVLMAAEACCEGGGYRWSAQCS